MTRRAAIEACSALASLSLCLGAVGDEAEALSNWPTAELHFSRMYYRDGGGYGRGFGGGGFNGCPYGGGSWTTDCPEAEVHFTMGIERLTRVDIGEGRALRLTDDSIFNYPWLYAVEVGRWYLDETDAARLREYLMRGGFMMVDDFHGTRQWASFLESLQRVFPDRPVVEIEESDEVMHVLYDLNKNIQIPGIVAVQRGVTYEQDGTVPHWRGIYDDDGRLMLAINFNMDLGDAWEHADTPYYPEPMTALAYRFAVNYVVYAMTH
jgi:hypothetical protein